MFCPTMRILTSLRTGTSSTLNCIHNHHTRCHSLSIPTVHNWLYRISNHALAKFWNFCKSLIVCTGVLFGICTVLLKISVFIKHVLYRGWWRAHKIYLLDYTQVLFDVDQYAQTYFRATTFPMQCPACPALFGTRDLKNSANLLESVSIEVPISAPSKYRF